MRKVEIIGSPRSPRIQRWIRDFRNRGYVFTKQCRAGLGRVRFTYTNPEAA